MAVTWTDVRDLPSGEFDTITQADAQFALDLASGQVNEAYWGTRYDKALLMLAAHFALLFSRGGTSVPTGPLISRTAGPFTEAFASGSSLIYNSRYDSTTYGQIYQMLVNSQRYLTMRMSPRGGNGECC